MGCGFIGKNAVEYFDTVRDALARASALSGLAAAHVPCGISGVVMTGVGNATNVIAENGVYEDGLSAFKALDAEMEGRIQGIVRKIEQACETIFVVPVTTARVLSVLGEVKTQLAGYTSFTTDTYTVGMNFMSEMNGIDSAGRRVFNEGEIEQHRANSEAAINAQIQALEEKLERLQQEVAQRRERLAAATAAAEGAEGTDASSTQLEIFHLIEEIGAREAQMAKIREMIEFLRRTLSETNAMITRLVPEVQGADTGAAQAVNGINDGLQGYIANMRGIGERIGEPQAVLERALEELFFADGELDLEKVKWFIIERMIEGTGVTLSDMELVMLVNVLVKNPDIEHVQIVELFSEICDVLSMQVQSAFTRTTEHGLPALLAQLTLAAEQHFWDVFNETLPGINCDLTALTSAMRRFELLAFLESASRRGNFALHMQNFESTDWRNFGSSGIIMYCSKPPRDRKPQRFGGASLEGFFSARIYMLDSRQEDALRRIDELRREKPDEWAFAMSLISSELWSLAGNIPKYGIAIKALERTLKALEFANRMGQWEADMIAGYLALAREIEALGVLALGGGVISTRTLDGYLPLAYNFNTPEAMVNIAGFQHNNRQGNQRITPHEMIVSYVNTINDGGDFRSFARGTSESARAAGLHPDLLRDGVDRRRVDFESDVRAIYARITGIDSITESVENIDAWREAIEIRGLWGALPRVLDERNEVLGEILTHHRG